MVESSRNSLKTQLASYLRDALGASIAPRAWPRGRKLPAFLRERYTLLEAELLGKPCLFMMDQERDEQPPTRIRKHIEHVQREWRNAVVYVRPSIAPYQRGRLIQNKVSFIAPNNQMYLPMLGIHFKERGRASPPQVELLSPATQVALLHALSEGSGQVFTLSALAETLGYSAMTMSRAFSELEEVDLGTVSKRGRDRCLSFAGPTRDIWDKAQPYLRSPVGDTHFVSVLDARFPAPIAGLSALSHYTMVAEPACKAVALTQKHWIAATRTSALKEIPVEDEGALQVEVWRYDPALFADNGVVDRLSLYLSLRETPDERIEQALDELLAGAPWR